MTASPRAVVLEARHRAGGRAWSSDELRCRLELDHGGRWIHGRSSPENPKTELADRHGIPTTASRDSGNVAEFHRKKKRRGNIKRVVPSNEGGGDAVVRSTAASREAEAASGILYKQLCQPGKMSLLTPWMDCLPLETSYGNCLVEIANREMPGKTFAEWIRDKARRALRAPRSPGRGGPLVREKIALLAAAKAEPSGPRRMWRKQKSNGIVGR